MLSPEAEFSLNYYDLGLVSPGRFPHNLKSKEKQDFQVVLLKEMANEEIKENSTEEYIYLTIALPVKISR